VSYAVIDVGSNTIRTLIGYVREGRLYRLFSDRSITRLASGLKQGGYLKEENIESSIKVLGRIAEVISRYNVENVIAVGTAALREAVNAPDFIDRVIKETGIRIRIISGEEEARLTIRGVLYGLDLSEDALIVDIGGGSTEWIVYDFNNPDRSIYGTIPIGVVNLLEGYVKNDPPHPDELKALEGYSERHIDEIKNKVITKDIRTLIGTGGSVTTLASIDLSLNRYEPELIHGHRLKRKRLEDMRDLLVTVPISLRRGIKGLDAERADLIIPGIILTIKIMDIYRFDELIVSDYGLLEGLLSGGKNEKGI
jgi:exopolyphosphatase/guanosine-5'-triphosphate,3'-diphosphate pyrophosphatase